MHTTLLAVMADGNLQNAAKLVYAYLYSRTNGSMQAEIKLAEALADLRISESTLRRHRAALRLAGCLESWLDGEMLMFELLDAHLVRVEDASDAHLVRVEDGGRAPSAREDAVDAHLVRVEDASDAHLVRVEDGGRAPSAREAPPRTPPMSVCLSVNNINLSDKQTNTGGVGGERAPGARTAPQFADFVDGAPRGEAEMARTYRLLTDGQVGISEQIARKMAGEHRFWWTLANVCTWRRQLQENKVYNVGALVQRLKLGWQPEQFTDADRSTPLFLRHVTPAEQVKLRERIEATRQEQERVERQAHYATPDAGAPTRPALDTGWQWHNLGGQLVSIFPGYNSEIRAATARVIDGRLHVAGLPSFGSRERKLSARIAQKLGFEVIFDDIDDMDVTRRKPPAFKPSG